MDDFLVCHFKTTITIFAGKSFDMKDTVIQYFVRL